NSGYAANLALLSALPQRGDTVLYDERAHACIKDGVRLSAAERFAFRHHDLDDLRRRLAGARGRRYVVVESIYSMDGDAAPLGELAALCREQEAALVVDEAHSTGLYAAGGAGLVSALGLGDDCLARVMTFGKALGGHGALVCGSAALCAFLVNFARPFIYTTALPPHSLLAIREAFFVSG
ncbi:MAG: aminotransferase class I/II-fold pyridoxal phosphate-dependent enzyme, partial [Cytophagales bacterium]|nr:aminotransferase class I/II-fold pyridoxal phosphate-dependent enzyme [Cytophagales bacterium]